MKTTQYLKQFYEAIDEDARLGSRHGSVEFLTTLHYLEQYLSDGMKLLEIGAGTGRYSHTLARQGFSVDAVELVPHNIQVFQANTQPGEDVRIFEGNAIDLSFLPDEAYDMTLLLGPMYHLVHRKDQQAALSEALRVTRKGGLLCTAYTLADASILQHGFVRGNIRQLIADGMLDPVTFQTHSEEKDIFQLYLKADIDALMADLPVQRLHYLGTDMATNHIAPTVDAMDDETFELYLRYHLSICERPELVGASHHVLDISRKLS